MSIHLATFKPQIWLLRAKRMDALAESLFAVIFDAIKPQEKDVSG
jgi:hypothetical protein